MKTTKDPQFKVSPLFSYSQHFTTFKLNVEGFKWKTHVH